jgi:all-trans-retinol dehydrogenase (NAD+)
MTEIGGKNILITGGACGIGRLMALKMGKEGGNMILWDINEENLNKVLDELKASTGREAKGYICDVSNRQMVYEVAEKVKEEVGPLDLLINNAGIVSGKSLLEIEDEKVERTFGVNTLSMFWTTKAFLPEMIKRNSGHLVTVASAAGWVGVARLTDYCSSKWAAVGFDESLRVELKKTAPGVKTTVVCPYYIDTGMFEGVKTRFSFLLPILKEEKVADGVVKAIRRNRAQVFLPPLVHIVPVLRFLPSGLFDTVANILGINASMDEFVGRQKQDG